MAIAVTVAAIACLVLGGFWPLDHWADDHLDTDRGRPLQPLIGDVSLLGSGEVTFAALAVLAVISVRAQRLRRPVGALAIALTAGMAVELTLKHTLHHPGPPSRSSDHVLSLIHLDTPYSFPSGHTIRIVLLAVCAVAVTHGRARSAAVALAIPVVAAVLFSRLALGEHWFSDVIGGVLVALALAPATWLAVARRS
jgi:membrane-associated phospholipid phosphatase